MASVDLKQKERLREQLLHTCHSIVRLGHIIGNIYIYIYINVFLISHTSMHQYTRSSSSDNRKKWHPIGEG